MQGQRQGQPSLTILFSVFAIGISYVAYGMMWPFVQIMGVTRGLSAQYVANGLSAYAVTAILGGLAAAALPKQIHRAYVFSVSLCVLLSSIYMLYGSESYLLFCMGCALFGFYWNFYLTLHLGVIARADNTGRGIVLCGVAPSLGVIVGSYLGGMMVRGADYMPLAKMGSVLCITGIVCTLATLARMKRLDRPTSTSYAAS